MSPFARNSAMAPNDHPTHNKAKVLTMACEALADLAALPCVPPTSLASSTSSPLCGSSFPDASPLTGSPFLGVPGLDNPIQHHHVPLPHLLTCSAVLFSLFPTAFFTFCHTQYFTYMCIVYCLLLTPKRGQRLLSILWLCSYLLSHSPAVGQFYCFLFSLL